MPPFRVLVDTGEQLPYTFAGLTADATQGRRPLFVPVVSCTLPAGDYSIEGYADKIAVERKSYADLAQTLTHSRQRFLRELALLQAMPVSFVVCEVELSQMMEGPPDWSRVLPKTLWRSVMAWNVKFPAVHWWFCPGREAAEAVTYRLLEKWYAAWVVEPTKKAKQRDGTARQM